VQVGIIFPQFEIGADPAVIREFAQKAESVGYSHLLAYEHVLGANIEQRSGWQRPHGDTHKAYTDKDLFHEPLVLFGFLAAVTQRIRLVTGVIVLPQRQTALVAKQTAEVDVLSGGRLRLGVGIGWNSVEYEALGMDFKNKAARIEEQIALLRAFWTEPVVDFAGKWHMVSQAGINPLPVQRPIPLWMGGGTDTVLDVVLERIARLGDGWFSQMKPGDVARSTVQRLRDYAQEAGRDPLALGIEARLNLREIERTKWRQYMDDWREIGATHISISAIGLGLSPQEHISIVESLWSELSFGDYIFAEAGHG
jgi:probable F420-dependent oxidoreductase